MTVSIVAFDRGTQGTGASRRLRNAGKTPGIIYGGSAEPQRIELDHNTLWHALKKEVFHSSVLDLTVGETTTKVVLRDVQYHPYKQQIQHVDFQRVDARTRLTVKVPLHFKGEEESDAVKLDHNLVNHTLTELEISVFPAELPEFIEVDLSGLKNGGTVHVNDLKLPKGAKWVSHGKVNPVVASAVAPAAEEPAPEAAAAPAAEPAKGKGKKK
ncbi:50S ribosomal protein L25/general stress protein Ctc [Xylophilus sp.]|uniref:50S ribosomal protein L25/general stress protein Ctc n=1 Tax=Xylophilus sp. TaxID=2653893 RepID=UPI0013B682B8|nr:50S ribosomal protein L25/general stress protein Ctc [Xylophilus sp.]KAF1049508.1 MAG: 50S ribosomal protein L25 [Xylophilus sp.]